ncbi:hypothetical protein HYW40_03235, partial [Candidatus Curtissbacteria bacterium]|nr:hypothetical protein [Candidatus Curtissbacteria bacterium]
HGLAKALGVGVPTIVRLVREEEAGNPDFQINATGGMFDPKVASVIAGLVRRAREEGRITPNYRYRRKNP